MTKHTPRSDKQTPTAKKKSPAVVPPSETRPRPEQPPRRIAPPRYRLALSEYEAPAERAWACAAPVEASPALQPGAQLVSDPATEPAPELPAAAPGAPEVVEPAPETAAPGQLLVIVTDGRAPAPVQVTQAPEAAPGYAQASTFCADLDGRWTWTQATVARECSGHEQSLVMLGGDIRQWGEEDDHDAMGSEGDQYGNSEDGAARGAVEPVDDRAGSGPARPQ